MEINKFGRIKTRRCKSCDQELIATCNTTEESEVVKFKTGRAGEPLVTHMMFPTAETQSDLCFRCSRAGRLKPGKDSALTKLTMDSISN